MAIRTNGKYASVWWTIEDMEQKARESDCRLTRRDARRLLSSIERWLAEAMVAVGWDVIEDALICRKLYGKRAPRYCPALRGRL
jgi:hypothetical protein